MNWVAIIIAIEACVLAAGWYFGRKTARRWNALLRRAGKMAEDESAFRGAKFMALIFSRRHRAFGDEALSRSVYRTRVWFAIGLLGIVLVQMAAAIIGR